MFMFIISEVKHVVSNWVVFNSFLERWLLSRRTCLPSCAFLGKVMEDARWVSQSDLCWGGCAVTSYVHSFPPSLPHAHIVVDLHVSAADAIRGRVVASTLWRRGAS